MTGNSIVMSGTENFFKQVIMIYLIKPLIGAVGMKKAKDEILVRI